jgi:signal transduction histidine kinase
MFTTSRFTLAPIRLADRASKALPRRTVRLRLTVLYGGLFLLSGAGLLAITNLLVHQSTSATFFISKGNGRISEHIQGVVGGFSTSLGPPVAGAIVTRPDETGAAQSEGSSESASAGGPVLAAPKQSTAPTRAVRPVPQQLRAQARQLTTFAARQRSEEQHSLLVVSVIALAVMAVISIALGWLISGRVLRPLRTITLATRRISEHNLHERLELTGPDDELKDLAETIDGLLGRMEAAFEAQRRFVANASHELRTPLTMMRTSLDVAVAKPTAPQLDVLEGKLREGLNQADRLLESFLMLARAQHGVLAEQSAVSLSRILLGAIRAGARGISEKRIEVTQEISDVYVTGSETLLSRMVENVIENAIRHNEQGGWMRVRTEPQERTVAIVVESGGAHLQQGAVEQLAQPFRRLGAERTGSDRGVGLGLSIVSAIAVAHGGELELNARPEGGLRVTIRLALTQPQNPPARLARAPA